MQLIRMKELVEKISVSRSTVWRLEKQGDFPKHFKLSARTTCWNLSEIEEWLKKRNAQMPPK